MTKKNNLVVCFILLAIVLVGTVPLVDALVSFTNWPPQKVPTHASRYPINEKVSGMISETLRALITCYLYATTTNRGSTIKHCIKYGLLYSALIASLYIILGGFYFRPADPVRFIIVDSFILLVQGILSGLVFYYIFKRDTP